LRMPFNLTWLIFNPLGQTTSCTPADNSSCDSLASTRRWHFVSYDPRGADTLHLPNCDTRRHHIVLRADTELDFSDLDLLHQLANYRHRESHF
jgi:hypothetical protein